MVKNGHVTFSFYKANASVRFTSISFRITLTISDFYGGYSIVLKGSSKIINTKLDSYQKPIVIKVRVRKVII